MSIPPNVSRGPHYKAAVAKRGVSFGY